MREIIFDDEDLQKHFNECFFRIESDEVTLCRGMGMRCMSVIESGQCPMLADYFTEHNLPRAMSFRCKEIKNGDSN